MRWAFNLAAAVSAVLFVAVCVLWVRSYWRADLFHYLPKSEEPGYSRYDLSSAKGEVRIARLRSTPLPPSR